MFLILEMRITVGLSSLLKFTLIPANYYLSRGNSISLLVTQYLPPYTFKNCIRSISPSISLEADYELELVASLCLLDLFWYVAFQAICSHYLKLLTELCVGKHQAFRIPDICQLH